MADSQGEDLYAEALQRFGELTARARETGLSEPLAMTLATAGADGAPDARIVLLRGWDERGFVFYTNTGSDKARDLAENPRAALCFHWDELHVQVRVAGDVRRVADDEADAYWAGRPRESQIGAWASQQSQTLSDRPELERRVQEVEQRFKDQPQVPRPEFWTGFRLFPRRIEFWNRQPARLHDRVVYERHPDGRWTKRLLYP